MRVFSSLSSKDQNEVARLIVERDLKRGEIADAAWLASQELKLNGKSDRYVVLYAQVERLQSELDLLYASIGAFGVSPLIEL